MFKFYLEKPSSVPAYNKIWSFSSQVILGLFKTTKFSLEVQVPKKDLNTNAKYISEAINTRNVLLWLNYARHA